MTHDPECLRALPADRYLPCICGRLARVRADERERAAEVIYTIYKAAFPMTDYEVGYCAGARASRDAIAAARGGE